MEGIDWIRPRADSPRRAGAARVSNDTPGRAKTWILVATILASSMVFIDGTVVNIALPVLQVDLNATIAQAQWVVQAYALFLSSLILVGGSLGDHFGRRRMFVTGVAVFGLASVLCGMAHSSNQLIAARALQGIASALLTPGSLSILTVSFGSQERGRAIGLWSSFTAATAAAGPALGGWIVQHASWRWIFFINVPLALVVLITAMRWIPESRDSEKVHHVDWVGSALATIGLAGLVYGLMTEPESGWGNPVVIAALAAGVLALGFFVFAEAREPSPMLPLSLFQSRNFSVVNILTFLLYGALGGTLFLLPFDLILVQHYTPTAAGLAFLPLIALVSLLSPWAGSLIRSVGAKLPLVVGPLITGLAMASLALPGIGGSFWTTFFPAVLALGLGMAITVAPLTTTVMSSVDSDHVGIASGANNAVSRTGGLLAIAALNLIVIAAFNHNLDRRLAALAPPPAAVAVVNAQRAKLAAAELPRTLPADVRTQLQRAIDESYVAGFRFAALTGAVLAFLGALAAAAWIEPARPLQREPILR